MQKDEVSLYVFSTRAEAATAFESLCNAGLDAKKLSLVRKDTLSEGHPHGFYTESGQIKSWGHNLGALGESVWGLLIAPAVFFLPGFGLMAMGGPVVYALINTLEGVAVAEGTSIMGATLATIGVPAKDVTKSEAALKMDKYVLIVHGNAEEVAKARSVLVALSLTGIE